MKIVVSLILAGAVVLGASEPQLGIDDFIEIAIEQSPDLNISRADYNASVQRTRNASGDYLPRLDLTGSAGVIGIRSNSSAQDLDNSSELLTGTLSASQLIYDFGKTGGNIDAFGYDANASYAGLQQTIANKVYEVKKAYYTALEAKSLIGVNEENVQLNEKQYERSKRYFEAGIRTRIDVTDAKVNLISARLALQNAHYDFDRARVKLERVIGTEPFGGRYRLVMPTFDSHNLFETLPDVSQPVKTLEAYAFNHRYELKGYAQNVQSARARLTSTRGDYYPRIFVQGDYTYTKTGDEAMELFRPEQQWDAMLALNWNLFEGMKTDARVEEQRANVMRSSAQYRDAKLRIRQEVADAHIQVLKNRDSVKLSQSLADAAKEKFVQAQKRYENGLSDYIELQQARQGYIDATSNLIIHYYDFYIALALQDRAIGR
jgi:outer membrane protein